MTDPFPMPEEAVDLLLAGQQLPKDLEHVALMPPIQPPNLPRQSTCKCSFRVRLVGDGCPTCNPDYWQQFNDPEKEKPE